MSSGKCDSAVMFGFIISLVLIFRGVVVITSALNCSDSLVGSGVCGDFVEIKYPFWRDDDEYSNLSDYVCGYPGFGIKCVDEARTSAMNISNQLYRTNNINYKYKYLKVKEMDIDGEECPHPRQNFSLQQFGSSLSNGQGNYNWSIFYNCSGAPNSEFVEKFHVACLDNSGRRSYAFPDDVTIPNGFNWHQNCEETLVVPISTNRTNYTLYAKKKGFDLEWSAPIGDCQNCEFSGGICSYYRKGGFRKCSCKSDFNKKEFDENREEFDKTCPQKNEGLSPGVSPSNQFTFKPDHHERGISPSPSKQPTITNTASELNYRQIGKSSGVKKKVLIGVLLGVGAILVVVLILYCKRILFFMNNIFTSHWRNNTKSQTNMEMFLESCEHLTVQRYKYFDIKKMTDSFKETLGGGGYGSVFKGKLKHDGRLVAVKLLKEQKGDGEDFINEVTTIGRTNHVNVVSLLGFCTEGTKRALVYEFMPNGSLEKFIYKEKTSTTPLGWEKLYQIALGIARGLEYLHRGCNTRILHFDIKPHNILLDQDFCPKISDFGLAKLCPTRESVVSMLVARGTIGYIAPEVYCRNFGGVSHKSDVYSYGMMVLEMIGGRPNIDATIKNFSEIHFPQWIYNHLKQDVNLEVSEEIFANETTRKMILVALWCIQRQPADRPSISKVVEMLEGRTEDLQMPPNPFEDFPSSSS